MKLGLGSYAYAWTIGVPGYPPPERPLDAHGLIQRAHALGLRLVQIADNLPLHTLNEAELSALVDKSWRLGVAVEVGTRGIDPAHLRTYLDIARRFQSPILRVVVDTRTHHPEPDEIVTTLAALMPEFDAAKVTLAIENHDRFKAKTLAGIVQQVRAESGLDRVGICLDTVNSFGALEGPEVVIAALGRYVINLHVKEFIVRRVDHNMGFVVEGKPAGQGMLDLPWLLTELRKAADGRPFNAILETWPPPEPKMAETIAKEDAWVVESIAYLRTLILE